MRRRAPAVEPGAGSPAGLLRFRYADWADESVRVPEYARHCKSPTWHHLRAWRRFLDARRTWCADNDRDYADTFHPEWSRRVGAPEEMSAR